MAKFINLIKIPLQFPRESRLAPFPIFPDIIGHYSFCAELFFVGFKHCYEIYLPDLSPKLFQLSKLDIFTAKICDGSKVHQKLGC